MMTFTACQMTLAEVSYHAGRGCRYLDETAAQLVEKGIDARSLVERPGGDDWRAARQEQAGLDSHGLHAAVEWADVYYGSVAAGVL